MCIYIYTYMCIYIYIYTYMCIHSYRHITITHIACMYIGKSVYDEENDEWTKEYSTWRRFVLKYTISTPVLICFILVVLSAMLSFFRSHDQMIASYNAGRDIEYFSSSSSSSSSYLFKVTRPLIFTKKKLFHFDVF